MNTEVHILIITNALSDSQEPEQILVFDTYELAKDYYDRLKEERGLYCIGSIIKKKVHTKRLKIK